MYKQVKKGWTKHLDFTILDIVFLELVFYLSYCIRHGGFEEGFILPFNYIRLGIFLFLMNIATVFLTESYKGILRRGYIRELKAVMRHMTIIVSGMLAYMYLMKVSDDYSRTVLLATYLGGMAVIYIERIIWKACLQNRFSKLGNARMIMAVTISTQAESLIKKLTADTIRNYAVTSLAIVDKDMTGQTIGGVKVNANQDNLWQAVCTGIVDEAFLSVSTDYAMAGDMARRFLDMGVTVHINMDHVFETLPNRFFEKIGGLNVMTTTSNMASPRQMLFKRLMDICGSLVGLLITAVIGLGVAPAIYIASPGPVIFSQTRVGKGGRKFRIYKFRSMYLDAEKRKQELMKHNKMAGLMFKVDDDPRIIKGIGAWIRKTSIDELPQFWNVLIGDMSLVGTRPPTVDEYEKYELSHKKRLSIKPGITGMWQVSGRSDITDFEQVVKLDNQYIDNWSIGLDVKILIKTVKIVLGGKGAE